MYDQQGAVDTNNAKRKLQEGLQEGLQEEVSSFRGAEMICWMFRAADLEELE